MSDRDAFQAGVPCWVDTWRADPDGAAAFYAAVLGWESEETTTPGSARRYLIARLRGRDAAAFGAPPPVEGAPPLWTTYVQVDDADETASRAAAAGGKVAIEPFDGLDGGRIAILYDSSDALIGVWQLGEHNGAGVVNEPGAWAMSLLHTPDEAAAATFYGELFGWTTEDFGGFTMFRLPGFVGGEPEQPVSREVVAVMVSSDPDAPGGPAPPHWRPDFWVVDADEAARTAEAGGGSVIVPPYDTPAFRQAVLADVDGAAFSVSQLIAAP